MFDYNVSNGLGHPAVSLYLAGCDKVEKCKGCHNKELQPKSYQDYDIDTIKLELDQMLFKFITYHSKIYVAIIGGEPLASYNIDITNAIATHVKDTYPDSITVVYTWRKLTNDNLVIDIDYAVCGGYKEALHCDNVLPSSTNQYIYDVKRDKRIQPIRLKR